MVVSRGHVLGCVKKFRGFRIGWRSKQWELKERPTPFHHLRIGVVGGTGRYATTGGARGRWARTCRSRAQGATYASHPGRIRVVGGMPVAQLPAGA